MVLLVLDRPHHVRCRKCEKRRKLPRHPDRYARLAPACQAPGCGHRQYRVDRWMEQRDCSVRGLGCDCGGYPWVHRKGSPYCWENALAPLRHADRRGDSRASLLRVARQLSQQFPERRQEINELIGD